MRTERLRGKGGWLSSVLLVATTAVPVGAAGPPREVRDVLGPNHEAAPRFRDPSRPVLKGGTSADRLRYWNQIAIDASGLDHTPVAPGESRASSASSSGPGRSSRAMAIVHIAIFDAVNAIAGGYGATRACARARPDRRWTPPSPRRPTTRWSRSSRRRRDASTRCSRRTSTGSAAATREERGASRSGGGRPRRSSRCGADDGSHHAEPRVGRRLPPERRRRAIGGRTRSARSRSRSARTGAR